MAGRNLRIPPELVNSKRRPRRKQIRNPKAEIRKKAEIRSPNSAGTGMKSELANPAKQRISKNCILLAWKSAIQRSAAWPQPNCAKRMECVQLAGAFGPPIAYENGSKLHALHTLRDIAAASKIVAK